MAKAHEIWKKLVWYVTMILLLAFLGYILYHAAGAVPLAKNIFADRSMYLLILPGSALFLMSLRVIGKRSLGWSERRLRTGILVIFFLIAALQLLYLYTVRTMVLYDNLLVLHEAAEMQTTGTIDPELYGGYFARYPHNYPITILLYFVVRAARLLHLSDIRWISGLFGMLCMDIALLFSAGIVRRAKGLRMCFLFSLLCAFQPVVYIWIIWSYSTVCSLPFLMGSIYFALRTVQERGAARQRTFGALFGVLAVLAVRIRVTSAIFLIAFVICGATFGREKRVWMKRALPAMAVAAVLTAGACGLLVRSYVRFDYTDSTFGPSHYVMMGLGEKGVHNVSDREFSARFPDRESRRQANVEEIGNRLEKLGAKGLISLFGDKTLVTWEDGSFGYWEEWMQFVRPSNSALYLCGEKCDLFLYYCQIFYVMLLALTAFGALRMLTERRDAALLALFMTLLGNMLFFLLWEAQNHYGIHMVFVLTMLGTGGFARVCAPRESPARSGHVRSGRVWYGGVWAALAAVLALLLYRPVFRQPFAFREFTVNNVYDIGQRTEGLASGDTLVQTFTADQPFNHIHVMSGAFADPERARGGCLAELKDGSGRTLVSLSRNAGEILKGQIDMIFDTVVPAGSETYSLVLTPKKVSGKNPLSFARMDLAVDIYPGGSLFRNGQAEDGDLLFMVFNDGTGCYGDILAR